MICNRKLDLQLFGEGGDAGDGAEGSAADVRVGDTLEDGTIVDENLASSMRENADMYPTRNRAAFGQGQQEQGTQSQQAGGQNPDEPTPEQWKAVKKQFSKFYGEDVKNAVNDRFKNQADANKQLEAMQPMIQALMQKTGAETPEELINLVLDDDSLYEDAANEMGMTVEQYKEYKQAKDENAQLKAQQQRTQEMQMLQQHVAGIRQQAEELKQLFPGFDIDQEMQNPEFLKLTQPGGISVKQAYMALHGDELIPQLMAFGVQQGRTQISKSIQANQARPIEGASRGTVAGGVQPGGSDRMSFDLYDKIKNRTMQGENVVL